VSRPIRFLVVDDSEDDSQLMARQLARSGWEPAFVRVEKEDDLITALHLGAVDLVIADYSLPALDALRTLEIVREFDPQLPCIVVSGKTGEEAAVETMRCGARDYVVKHRLERLGPVVERVLRDAEDHRRMAATERALREVEQRFRAVVDTAVDAVITIDEPGTIETFNAAAERMFGYRSRDAIGHNVQLLLAEPYRGEYHEATAEAAGTSPDQEPEVTHHRIGSGRELVARDRYGWTFPVEVSVSEAHISGRRIFTWIVRDIRERKAFEAKLATQALRDPLTQLANRTLLVDRVRHALSAARRTSARPALLFLDLDRFKVINDSLGHTVGDEVLRVVAQRLLAIVRPADTVARFGGDEFVLLCEDVERERGAEKIAERVAAALQAPLSIADTDVYVSASIGIALIDDPSLEAETLLRDADSAMYRAKERGRNRFEIFDAEMRARVVARLEVEQALHRAIDRGELRLHYQPELSLATGEIVGFEALLRWQHPERGLLRPDQFLAVAEDTGLIVPIGAWVIEEACREATRWSEATATPPTVWVNVSVRQLVHPELTTTIASALHAAAGRVTLGVEITENALMSDPTLAVATTIALRDLGVRVSIDDFGTGYSSLSHLKRFPIDALKVDQSFVHGLGRNNEDTLIVSAVVGLGKSLGLDVVAEGVETPEQVVALTEMGCATGQGYYFDEPLPPDIARHRLAAAD
jgi:diguanylate cyclase (GGDEF)-like protein/PAS domain S-box-containing protein